MTISTTTSVFSGIGGSTINIPCTYVGYPAITSVQWIKIRGGVSQTLHSDGNKYKYENISMDGLTINNLVDSDTADYQCTATNPVGTGKSEIVTLTVNTQGWHIVFHFLHSG